jgi:hypothetical protein
MPSDAVTIAVAFASPTVAGIVAVVIHRQRLSHEQRERDLDDLRELLSEAVVTCEDLVRALVSAADRKDPEPVRTESLRRLRDVRENWERFDLQLSVLLDPAHELVRATDAVTEAVRAHESDAYEDTPGDDLDPDSMTEALERWHATVRKVVRARL